MKSLITLTSKLLLVSSIGIGAAQASYIHVHEDNFSAGVTIMNMKEDAAVVNSDHYSGSGLLGTGESLYADHVTKYGSAGYRSYGNFIRANINTDDAPIDFFDEEEQHLAGYLASEVYANWDTTFSMEGDTQLSYTMSTFGNAHNSSATHEHWWSVELVDLSSQEVVFDSDDFYQGQYATTVEQTLFDGRDYSLSVSLYGYGDTHDDHPFFAVDFGYGAEAIDQTASVAEPSVIGLMLLGMAGLFVRKKSLK